MIEKARLRQTIKKNADGDFSTFMSRTNNSKDVMRLLDYAAKKANEDQKKIMKSEQR